MMAAACAALAAALALWPAPDGATGRLVATRRGRAGQASLAADDDGAAVGDDAGHGTDAFAARLFAPLARRSRRVDVRVAVRALAEDLEAGALPAEAWRRAAGLAGACAARFRQAGRAIGVGGSIDAAFADAPDPSLGRLAAVWSSSAQSGAASAEVLRRWIEDADAREQAERARDVALAGPRASAIMLAALPLFGVLLGVAIGADPIGAVTASASGAALGIAGVLLDLLGVLWMLRIIAGARRR